MGARVVTHPPVPIVEAVRNVVADAATGDWIVALDPDERVSPGLASALRRLSTRSDIDAGILPRMNFDFGYPASSPLQRYEPQLRMYRARRGPLADLSQRAARGQRGPHGALGVPR